MRREYERIQSRERSRQLELHRRKMVEEWDQQFELFSVQTQDDRRTGENLGTNSADEVD